MSINNLIKFRKGIATEWSGQNPILASGEPGYDGTNNILKVGDGDTNWLSLSPVNANISGYDLVASTGNFDVLSFNVDNESILTKGEISWDDTEGVLDVGLTDTVTMHVGQHRFYRVRNTTGGVLYKGQTVYATGVHSNGIITPDLYVADDSIDEVRFIGIMLEDVSHNSNGYVIDFGHVEDIDLDGSATNYAVGNETWNNGDILYAHPTSAGKLTNVKPKHAIAIAIILDTGTENGNGRMFVRPTTYGDLGDNHDVSVGSATNGQFLQYNATTDYWVPSSSGNFTTLQLNGSGVLVEHPTITAASSVDNSNGTTIQDITLDSNGHVTALGSVDLDARYYTETEIDAFNYVDGGGTANYVAKWSDTDTLTSGIIYDNGTNVGIGTASPQAKLDVSGFALFGTSAGSNTVYYDAGQGLDLVKSTDSTDGLHFGDKAYSISNLYQGIKHLAMTGSQDYMMVSAGTHTYISSKATIGSVYIRGGGNYNSNQIRVYPSTMPNGAAIEIDGTNTSEIVVNQLGNNVDFRVEGDADTHLLSTDASTDRVGIGTASPSYKFEVVDGSSKNGYAGATAYVEHTSNGDSGYVIKRANSKKWTLFNDYSDSDKFKINSGGYAGTTAVTVDSSLNVGIGTASPSYKLDVVGSGRFVHADGDCGLVIEDATGRGIHLGDCALSVDGTYAGMTHSWYNPDEFMIISRGDHTFLSAASGYDTIIRGGNNNVGSELRVKDVGDGQDAIIFNEQGYDRDVRMEGIGDEYVFHLDASTDRIGIGTATPQAKLDVVYPQSGCVRFTDPAGSGIMIGDCALSSNADYAGIQHTKMVGSYMMVSDGDDTYISARDTQSVFIRGGGNNANSEISIHDVDIGEVGIVFNEQGADRDIRMEGVEDTNLFRLDASTDSIGIGTSAPSEKLHVNGNVLVDNSFYTSPTGTIVGTSGWIYQSGQQVLSNGSFGTHIGDAQFTQNILRAQTTDATLTNLTIGTQSGILLASNRTYNFTVNVVGRRTNGQDNAGYKLEGLLVNDGYGTQLLGNPIKTTLYESDTSWDTQVSVTGAGAGGTDYLLVQCQGASSKNINWVAHVDMLEVGGNIDGYTEANVLNINDTLIP